MIPPPRPEWFDDPRQPLARAGGLSSDPSRRPTGNRRASSPLTLGVGLTVLIAAAIGSLVAHLMAAAVMLALVAVVVLVGLLALIRQAQ